MQRVRISVLLPDRIGLLCDTTGVLFRAGGNINAVRETLLDGFFSLICTVTFETPVDPAALRQGLRAVLGEEAEISAHPFSENPRPVLPQGARFIAVTHGPDKPGTIHGIAQFFAGRGVNITDWSLSEEDGRITYIASVVLPPETDFRTLQTDFRACMTPLGLAANLCHENIFRATGEIGPIKGISN